MSTEQNAPMSDAPTGSVGPRDAEYIARAEKAEAAAVAATSTTAPDIQESKTFAGKFKSADELEKAYIELQSKLGAPKQPDQKVEEVPADAPKGLNMESFNEYVDEYSKSGALSEASYKKLESLGVSRDLVDSYVEGRKVAAAAQEEAIYKEVGGRDQYSSVLDWASKSLSNDDIEQYNRIVQSGDQKAAAFAAKALFARFRADTSREPSRVIEGRRSGGDVGFASKAEMVAAMQDPRYQKDPAYRSDVIRRISFTNS